MVFSQAFLMVTPATYAFSPQSKFHIPQNLFSRRTDLLSRPTKSRKVIWKLAAFSLYPAVMATKIFVGLWPRLKYRLVAKTRPITCCCGRCDDNNRSSSEWKRVFKSNDDTFWNGASLELIFSYKKMIFHASKW